MSFKKRAALGGWRRTRYCRRRTAVYNQFLAKIKASGHVIWGHGAGVWPVVLVSREAVMAMYPGRP